MVMRESAGHFDFGHFYFCPKMISARLSFSCDWKKIRFFIRIVSKQFQCGFWKHFFAKFSFFFKFGFFSKTRIGHFLSLGVLCIKRFANFVKKIPYNVVKENLQKNANQNTPKSWSIFHGFSPKKHK